MPLGTNGNSIYRPETAPPGTVTTGEGIGIQFRDSDGNVAFVLGLDDGKIYVGDVYASPNTPIVQRVDPTTGLPPPVTNPSGLAVVTIDGNEYVRMSYERDDGTTQDIDILKSLYDDFLGGGVEGGAAAMMITAAIADMIPELLPMVYDYDFDGDKDIHDAATSFEQAFLGQAQRETANGNAVNGAALAFLAGVLPDMLDFFANVADIATGDGNDQPPGGGGPEGGDDTPGGGDWLL